MAESPKYNIVAPRGCTSSSFASTAVSGISPLNAGSKEAINTGTITQTREGMSK